MRAGWEYKKLGEVCEINMGQSPEGTSLNDKSGVEFHQGKTCFGERFLRKSSIFSDNPIKIADENTVLLCVRAPVGFPNITDRKICIGRGLCALKPQLGLENTFLFYVLLGKQSYFEKNATGSTFKAISSKVINQTEIPLPPIPQQRLIVSELDKINSLIALKREQLKKYDELAQSLFYEMFGDPVENEKGWEVKKLIEIVDPSCSVSYGIVQPGDDQTNGIPIVRPVDLTGSVVYKKGLKQTTQQISDSYSRTILNGSELLMCVRGTTGIVSLAAKELEGCNVTRGITPLYFGDRAERWFMYYQFVNSSIRHIIEDYTKGIALKQINMADLRKVPLILPPLSLQRLFAQHIEQIEEQKKQVTAAIAKLETLLASRMQYWFE